MSYHLKEGGFAYDAQKALKILCIRQDVVKKLRYKQDAFYLVIKEESQDIMYILFYLQEHIKISLEQAWCGVSFG